MSSTETDSARRLGVYLHWPYCAAICPYCDFNVYRARGRHSGPLMDAILLDLASWRESTGARPLQSLFLGGGTPSLMDPRDVGQVIEACDRLWGFAPDAEITLEANPTDAEAARFAGFAASGVNRLSLGLQALDDIALKQLGRFHTASEGTRAADIARKTFRQLSVDLIYARPGQSVPAWRDELSRALSFAPDHVSPYQLTIEAGTAFERAFRRGALAMPDPDLAADLFETTQDALESAGFEAYEISNHARSPEARSRHNLLYWTSQDWVGVGPGAHGRLWTDGHRVATEAWRRPEAYIAAVRSTGSAIEARETLSDMAARDEFWLMGLRIAAGAELSAAPGAELDPRALNDLTDLGLVWRDGSRVGLTRRGRALGDSVVAKLLG